MKKIAVAMSGGVDSSVAAALLKKEGCDVFGIFMRLHDFSRNSEKRAKKIASFLKIPLKIIDLRKEFSKKIIKCFLREQEKGVTPNPCVICNKEIKFGLLMEKASKFDADFIATGHYARIKKTENKKQKTEYKLLKGKDKEKDQSYFLWKLSQKQLKRILFPVGNFTRLETERIAKEIKLPLGGAEKSVEACFIPQKTNQFLESNLKKNIGNIVDQAGKILGRHNGLYFYTIGQRKGIKLPGGPFYVTEKDYGKNWLIVTKNKKDLFKREIKLKNINWVSGSVPKLPLRISAKIRYRAKSVSAVVSRSKSKPCSLIFKVLQRAVTPGQSAVFYKNKELLGGGIIC